MRWTFAALCVVMGCVSAPKPELVKPSDPAIRYGGFVDRTQPDAPRFAWSGTHFEARFTGTTLLAKLSSTPVDPQLPETDFINVFIDGGPPKVFRLLDGEHWYPLATNLAPGGHRVLVWKRTECGVGITTFHGFKLDDGAKVGPPLPSPARRMLFIGDSITAGFGNEGPNPDCGWSAELENSYLTYGAVAARALGAQYIGQAWSGKGILRNGDDTDTEFILPNVYDRVIPSEPGSPKIPTLPVDVVVLNLGTNDFGPGDPGKAALVGAFDRMLDALRKRYPSALIVLMLGPMLSDEPHLKARTLMRDWLTEIRNERVASGDAFVELFEAWTDPTEGVGCAYHPNVKTHARIGAELTALVQQRFGW
jgi:lysophospholipase L1-like esterase